MVFRIAWRNLQVNFVARLPQAAMVALTVALLFTGNSLLESSRLGLMATYRQSFTGDGSVSTKAPDDFTLFGSELPLIGEYVVTPPLPSMTMWQPVLGQFSDRLDVLPQVSASAFLLLPQAKRQAVPVFGIDAPQYFHFFPALTLEAGTLTPAFPHPIWINRTEFRYLTKALGREPLIGEEFDLGMTVNGSFLIRTVNLAGVYRYPGSDPLLDRTLLVDPGTARTLDGYTVGSTDAGNPDPAARNLLGSDLDSLFDNSEDQVASAAHGIDLAATERQLSDTAARDASNATLAGSWNFLLVKAKKSGDESWQAPLQAALDRAGMTLQVRDWVATAGGNALVVSFLQVLFSVGLGLVVAVAALIVMNNLALSVVERTQEIGTWRALGATWARVALVLVTETVTLIFASALTGLAVASLGLWALSGPGIAIGNPFLASLLGTPVLRPSFTPGLWGEHLGLSLALALAACWLPVRRSLAITPLQAMQREA